MPKRKNVRSTRRPVKRRLYKRRRTARRRSSLRPRMVKQEMKKKEIAPTDALPLNSDATAMTNTLQSIIKFSKVPETWVRMTRGVNQDQLIGQDCCIKYIHVKQRITFPNMKEIELIPYFRVMHGWVKMSGAALPADGATNTAASFNATVDTVLAREFSKVLEGPDRSVVRVLSDKVITRKGILLGDKNLQRLPIDLHFKWAPNRVTRYSTAEYGNVGDFLPTATDGLWIPWYAVWDQTNTFLSGSVPSGYTFNALASQQTRETLYFTDS